MRAILLLSFGCAYVLASSSGNTHIRELSPSDFIDIKHTIVNFGTPYCGHCKALQPLWQASVDYLAVHKPDLVIGTVNCIDHGDFCSQQGITSFPRLREYSSGSESYKEFEGRQGAEKLLHRLTDGAVSLKPLPAPPSASTTQLPASSTSLPLSDTVYVDPTGSNAVVRLDLPGAPFSFDHASSVILNFTFTNDRHHLVLNDQVFALTVPNPSVPARLEAPQLPSTVNPTLLALDTEYRNDALASSLSRRLLLDYEFRFENRDDPNIRYYNYHPVLLLNIIGCRSLHAEREPHTLLDAPGQHRIMLKMRDQSKTDSTNPKRNFTIDSLGLLPRKDYYRTPEPSDTRSCGPLSWRCADIADPPWYEIVWQDQFDQYGRIGSLRWRTLRLRDYMISLIASMPWPLWALMGACAIWRVNVAWRLKESQDDREKMKVRY